VHSAPIGLVFVLNFFSGAGKRRARGFAPARRRRAAFGSGRDFFQANGYRRRPRARRRDQRCLFHQRSHFRSILEDLGVCDAA
jgi:hypothetical protein